MSSLSDVIPVPTPSSINTGLSSPSESTMLNFLGVPGEKTRDCSPPSPEFRRKTITADVGPFRVTGLREGVSSLKAIFAEVKVDRPDVYEQVKTAGMLCVRHRRGNPSLFSNHSWGAAIDLYFGTDGVIAQGVPRCHRGVLALYPYFHRHGWYWGAEFSGSSVDSMHFEMAKETIIDTFGRQPDTLFASVEAEDLQIYVDGRLASRQEDAVETEDA